VKPLTVLFVINGLGTGGAERSLAELLPGLRAEGIESIVACLYRRELGVERAILDDKTDVRFVSAKSALGRARALRRLMRAIRPDIVHTTIYEASVVARIACIGFPAIVLTSLVNTPYAPARLADPRIDRRRLAIVRWIDGWTARHLTDHFHAITNAVADHAVAMLGIPRQRITVIERGRDAARLGNTSVDRRMKARRALGLPRDAEVVLNVGRQEFQKGQVALVEATAALAQRRRRLVTLVAGRDGAATSELRERSERLALDGHLRFLGHREDVPDLLAAADVFAFPSKFEGLGGSLIEAMAIGLPIVASDVPAIREIIEPNGNATLVPPGSASALASAIEDLLDDPAKAATYGARGRMIFRERFTLDRSTQRTVDLYRTLAGRSSSVEVGTGS